MSSFLDNRRRNSCNDSGLLDGIPRAGDSGVPSTPLPFTVRERQFVYSVALKYMRSRESAEEVTQDALITAYRHRDQFRGDSKATTWLYRVAATTALMQLRKRTPP